MRVVAATFALTLFATPAMAAVPDLHCTIQAANEAFAFTAGRSLDPSERAALERATRTHANEASPRDCDSLAKLRQAAANPDIALRAMRRVDVHAAMWFALGPNDPRRALLQRIAPVAFDDPARKLIVRERALDAYRASVRFAAKQYAMAAPPDGGDMARVRAQFRAAPRNVAALIVYQEACWIALQQRWPRKSAAWRKQTLGPKPASSSALPERAMKLQLAVVPRAAQGGTTRRFSSTLARYNAAMNRGLVSSAMTGALNAGRP